ncbi:MAG: phosphatase PAP2 family protein [Minicystis sp.]
MLVPARVQQLDEAILVALRSTPPPLVTFFMILTVVGGGWGLVVLIPFIFQKRTRASALRLLGASLVTTSLVALLKELFGRVRPCNALDWCSPLLVNAPSDHSFPSGHAAGVFTFAAFIAVRAPRYAAPALLFALLVGISRCVLGVHYPSDVLGGAVLGTSIGALAARIGPRATPGSG